MLTKNYYPSLPTLSWNRGFCHKTSTEVDWCVCLLSFCIFKACWAIQNFIVIYPYVVYMLNRTKQRINIKTSGLVVTEEYMTWPVVAHEIFILKFIVITLNFNLQPQETHNSAFCLNLICGQCQVTEHCEGKILTSFEYFNLNMTKTNIGP